LPISEEQLIRNQSVVRYLSRSIARRAPISWCDSGFIGFPGTGARINSPEKIADGPLSTLAVLSEMH